MSKRIKDSMYRVIAEGLKHPEELHLDYHSASEPLKVDGTALMTARRVLKIMQLNGDVPPTKVYRTPIGAIKFEKITADGVELMTAKPSGKVHFVALDKNNNVIAERQFSPYVGAAKAAHKRRKRKYESRTRQKDS